MPTRTRAINIVCVAEVSLAASNECMGTCVIGTAAPVKGHSVLLKCI